MKKKILSLALALSLVPALIPAALADGTKGSPVAFESSGYTLSEFGKTYPYKTATWRDVSITTIGKVTLSDFRIIQSDGTHQAKAGYEWRLFRSLVEYDDDAAWEYGTRTRSVAMDYYNFNLDVTDDDLTTLGSEEGEEIYTVNFHGVDYEIIKRLEVLRDEWTSADSYIFETKSSYLVPIGYDGVLIAFYNAANYGHEEIKPLSQLIDKDTLFFRLASPAPAPAPALTAAPTAATVYVNGEAVAFDAYSINQENYFKLRDVAYIFDGTRAGFDAAYDAAKKMISIVTGKPYTPDGSEMQPKSAGTKTPTLNRNTILLDGVETEFTAYSIEGNNYFKMRELAIKFDFYVGFDAAAQAITIDTARPYEG